MAYVITEPCRRESCNSECLEMCPVDSIHGTSLRLYIDPQVCIDCGACAPACPIEAIVEDVDGEDDAEINAAWFRQGVGP